MPNEQDKNTVPGNKPTMHQLPIDLAPNKVIVKPANDNSKMSIQQTTFRTIQPPQMRVVRMPSGSGGAQIIQTQIMPQAILKPSIPGRSITVSKAQNYLPRVTATLNTIQGAKGQQQIRTPTPPSSIANISPAMLRTSIQPRTSSPNTVISQGTAAWVTGGGAMQVQVPQIIRSAITQNTRTLTANLFGQQGGQQNSTISVSTSSSGTSGQPTYVATVLPQRPQGATIVYTSQQQQPLFQGQVQRMGIATTTGNARQIRPIRQISTTGIRVNSSTLSIRQNVPGLSPTTILSTQPRSTSGLPASTAISSPIPARIYQVQSQQSPSGSQVIGQSNPKILQANVMLPIIVNNSRNTHIVQKPVQQGLIAHVSKLTSGTVSSDGSIISNSMTNTMPTISNTMVASIQPNQSIQAQVSQGTNQQQGTIYTTQSTQQVSNLGNQGTSQIITVSQHQQQQLINNQQNIHQGGNIQTVVPLARSTNIPIKTITVSASNSAALDSSVTVHRNLTSNAANLQTTTTIMPVTKIVSQHQVVNSQHSISGAQVSAQPVYIHTRIPTVSAASTAHSQVISAQVSNTASTFTNSTPTAVYYEQASLSSTGNNDNKATTSVASNENTYGSATNVQRFSEKMIHSFITSSFQNQNTQGNTSHIQQQQQSSSNQQSVPIRFSPLVVESQTGQQGSHQIITMGNSNLVQQQQLGSSSEPTTHMIVPVSNQIPTSPRGANARKQADTPSKGAKKQPKVRNCQIAEGLQVRVPQRAAGIAQLTQTLKPIEQKQLHSTASSPKTTFSERESPSHVDEWSDGSTTVSIPNSPRSEEDDLDAMILHNQFNKMSEEFVKFANKSPGKSGVATKREAGDHGGSPRTKKVKQ